MSSHARELLNRMQNRYSKDSLDMSMGEWVCKNTTIRGRPFSFKGYPFQERIVDDLHPNMDVVKPSQVGLTETQIRKAAAFTARNRGTKLIFTLPTEAMFERTSTTRILPIIKEDKVFNLENRNGEKPVRSRGLMQIGSSFMFVTPCAESAATSIDADVVMNDEVDLSDQKMLALFQSRMQNSDFRINQRFSTPTFHQFGIDQGYQGSDQHVYMCKCDSCGHWNDPVFSPKFIDIPGLSSDMNNLIEIDENLMDTGTLDLVNSAVVCERCRAPLDLSRADNREWVAKFPSRTHSRGYKVTPFCAARLNPEYIVGQLLKYKQRDFLRGFYNTVLGEPFTAGNARLSLTEIQRCFTSHLEKPDTDRSLPTWIGIDMGLTAHLVLGQGESISKMHVVEFRTIPVEDLVNEVQTILDTYNVIGGAVDRHPYTPTADALRDISHGRIIPVEYRGQKELNLVKDPLDPERILHGQVNRTQLIDSVAKEIRLNTVSFSGYGTQKGVISEHLMDMVREETAEKPATWIKLTGNDHYFHALAFLFGALKLKEYEFGVTSDPRTTVHIELVEMPSVDQGFFGITGRKHNWIG